MCSGCSRRKPTIVKHTLISESYIFNLRVKCYSNHSFIIVCSDFVLWFFFLVNFRLKSKRIYKTLLRSHHKHSSSESHRGDSVSTSSDVTDPPDTVLKRSSSTPSLKRCWLCQPCSVLNNSVTWHCLNCECVSIVAPIYKDTLQKGCIRADTEAATNKDNHNFNNNARCKSKPISSSVSCNKLGALNAMNQSSSSTSSQTTTTITPSLSSSTQRHIDIERYNRFSHRPMDMCPVLVAANSTAGDLYVKQVKYNEVTRFRPVGGLCPLNRHIENKSLPNIFDAFRESNAMPTQEMSENFFGERILTVNKPNALASSGATTMTHGINSARKAVTPIHEIHKFTRFATKSAVRESAIKKICTAKEACRMCNLGRCNNDNFPSNKNQSENPLDTSRFTITTLSRNNAVKTKDKNQTLTRNGGVLIAVRDWSMEKSPVPKNGCSTAPMSPDSYYEILRNPNNNAAPESNNKENNRVAKTQQPACAIYENSVSAVKIENNGPIYAVVNKMNKTKNTKQTVTNAQGLRSPELTKFTYIGMSPTTNVIPNKLTTESDAALHASTKSSQHNNNHNSNNNNGALTNVMPSLNSVNNNNGVSSSNECTPTATNVEFSTKVWKGNKKPIEPHKK